MGMVVFVKKSILVLLIFAATMGTLQCHKTQSTEPEQKPPENPDQLSGYLYMVTRKPTRLIHYSLYGETFYTMIDSSINFIDAAISGNGKMFCYAPNETTLVVSDISSSTTRQFQLIYPIQGNTITMNEKGTMVAYVGTYQNQSALVFYFPDDQRNQVMASSDVVDFHYFSPLFSRYGDMIAVSSDSGLFIGRPPRYSLQNLTTLKIAATDFSPSNIYLSAGRMIFDVIAIQPHPGNFGEGILFVTDNQVVYHEDDMRSIVISDISALHKEMIVGENKLIHTYAVSQYGTNLVYIYHQEDRFLLNFLTIETGELKRTVEMPCADSTYISKIVWLELFNPNQGEK